MLGRESQAHFFLLNLQEGALRLPDYIRLGKFNSKAHVEWERLSLESKQPEEREEVLDFLLNAADLPSQLITKMRAFSIYNLYPAPLLSRCHLEGDFWHCKSKTGKSIFLPVGMRFGVDVIE